MVSFTHRSVGIPGKADYLQGNNNVHNMGSLNIECKTMFNSNVYIAGVCHISAFPILFYCLAAEVSGPAEPVGSVGS